MVVVAGSVAAGAVGAVCGVAVAAASAVAAAAFATGDDGVTLAGVVAAVPGATPDALVEGLDPTMDVGPAPGSNASARREAVSWGARASTRPAPTTETRSVDARTTRTEGSRTVIRGL